MPEVRITTTPTCRIAKTAGLSDSHLRRKTLAQFFKVGNVKSLISHRSFLLQAVPANPTSPDLLAARSGQPAHANAIGFVRTALPAEEVYLELFKANAGSYLTQINYRDNFSKALIYKGLVGALDGN